MMNDQQIFDTAAGGVLQQKGQSVIHPPANICALRGNEGAKCAIGWLISDQDYDPNFEGNSDISSHLPTLLCADPEAEGLRLAENLMTLPFGKALSKGVGRKLDPNLIAFLAELQDVHDNSESHGERLIKYEELAISRGLNPSVAQTHIPE